MSLRDPLSGDDFVSRHIGPDDAAVARMLGELGVGSLDELIDRAVPPDIRCAPPELPEAVDEAGILAELTALAGRNMLVRSLIGQGYHGTIMPAVIRRNILENPGWYTAYTPYQPEIAQGRLEMLFAFQTMIADLTGLPVAGASLLDEATAAAEAMAMALGRPRAPRLVAVAADLHPQTVAVLRTRAMPLGVTITVIEPGCRTPPAAAAVIMQYPGSSGEVRDLTDAIAAAHAAGALAIVCADPLSLALLKPPGEMGADIVVGSAQRFGVPMGFGGPHAGYLATTEALRRAMPGRLVGLSVDADGAPALRLALQTREQHIRREKATSNICTAQVLLAVIAAAYAVWHGADGIARIAGRVHLLARMLAEAARRGGFKVRHARFFDTVAIECDADAMLARAADAGFNLRRLDDHAVGVSLDETVGAADIAALCALFGAAAPDEPAGVIDADLQRRGRFLTAPVFVGRHSEHAMLRWLKSLEAKDLSLTSGMIPLGSCTMKLNAAVEMLPISLPGFADIHPFAPREQTEGYLELIGRLSEYLAAITGLSHVSMQPNAGSQGEYAGLLAIRAYHAARGQAVRDICLIPASAHGTNPASAVMAGLRVVVVACDRGGNVDLDDLRGKLSAEPGRVAALMITYPSTHGVFEASIREICALVHDAGGQVYMDGANMNAQVGITSPAAIGADVCHLNLHKTFCIPHGGGGPGVGPIAVAAHLAPHLPNHPMREDAGPAGGVGPVAAAPFGSALILPISYAYIRLMGAQGLRRATQMAILAANYIAARLRPHYPVLFSGPDGLVAHECIIDCRAFVAEAGVSVEDIAKRLQDYGFHAPTMSWPVAGTLMIEPTESEPLEELDRFCNAMIAVRAEIAAIGDGRMDRLDNPLKNAPHTLSMLLAEPWTHPYSRAQAAVSDAGKYWPPVRRVDNVHGDRNLICSCPTLESYALAAD